MKKWTTADGREIPIVKLERNHVLNIARLMMKLPTYKYEDFHYDVWFDIFEQILKYDTKLAKDFYELWTYNSSHREKIEDLAEQYDDSLYRDYEKDFIDD